MIELLNKYAGKLVSQGLCNEGEPLLGGLDADLVWNGDDPRSGVLTDVIGGLNINSILFARPAEPYRSIIDSLTRDFTAVGALRPEDSETRTFLHDIPVCPVFDAAGIIGALERRKCVVIPGEGIVSYGTVSPEQAFVVFSSVCFSLFVKFFTDYLVQLASGTIDAEHKSLVLHTIESYRKFITGKNSPPPLMKGPFSGSADVNSAIIQAGARTVEYRLVDSFFGNISYRTEKLIHISQTGSSLDELSGCIDPCPADGSSCTAITASSEYSAHREIYACTGKNAILHGHPKFCVIMSMSCDRRESCANNGQCHRTCATPRGIGDVPIVPGEVGTGTYGLCSTLPPAVKNARGAIVYGHGLFTTGDDDFTDAFANLLDIERMCVESYLEKIR